LPQVTGRSSQTSCSGRAFFEKILFVMDYTQLPHLNAVLNSLSAVLLVLGFLFIRRKRIRAHRAMMTGALVSSALFLISYLTYHFVFKGLTRFTGQGIVRNVYLLILLTHTVLAAIILPLVLITVTLALRGDFQRHRRIARWTFPLWLYVSVTGVIVYLMLYQLKF
jgi:putative membrane protein